MILSAFKVQFPELAAAGDTLLQAMLDAAALQCSATTWGALRDQGQAYLAAHMLALSPYGQNARLDAKDGVTTYSTHYQTMLRSVSSGYRVC